MQRNFGKTEIIEDANVKIEVTETPEIKEISKKWT